MSQTTSAVSPADGNDQPISQAAASAEEAALLALTGGTTQPVARFSYDAVTGRWWWSPELYALHGLAPGQRSPSTALLLSHKHPEDRPASEETLRAVLATGAPFCSRHRLIDAQGKTRTVLALGEGVRAESGTVVAVHGYFIDVTETLRRQIEHETQVAVAHSAETRGTIDQAKGLLVAAFNIDPDAAFDLLTAYSQHTNTKVRVLAQDLVDVELDHGAEERPDGGPTCQDASAALPRPLSRVPALVVDEDLRPRQARRARRPTVPCV